MTHFNPWRLLHCPLADTPTFLIYHVIHSRSRHVQDQDCPGPITSSHFSSRLHDSLHTARSTLVVGPGQSISCLPLLQYASSCALFAISSYLLSFISVAPLLPSLLSSAFLFHCLVLFFRILSKVT